MQDAQPSHVVCFVFDGAALRPNTKIEERAQGMEDRAKTQQTTNACRLRATFIFSVL
jgi:hypothetical protein